MSDEEQPINDRFNKIHEQGIVPEDEKPLPYLGWWLVEPSGTQTAISYFQGQFWIDTKKKWDYPSSAIATDKLVKKAVELLDESLADNRPPNHREFQTFLSEQTGTFERWDMDTGERVEVDVRGDGE